MSGQPSSVINRESKPQGPAANAAQHVVDGVARVLAKPRFRGWIHVYSAGTAVFAGRSRVPVSWAVASPRPGLATLAYPAAPVVMFTVSATYHRIRWTSETAR